MSLMRRWTSFVLALWVATIVAQTGAWAAAMPGAQAPASGAMMGCSDMSMDMPAQPKKPDDCSRDADCMARCTFVQPAIAGPVIAVSLPIIATVERWSVRQGVAQYAAAPPFRPPNPSIPG